jgi:hypothetical protein
MKTMRITLLALVSACAVASAACNDTRPSSLSTTPHGVQKEDPTKSSEEQPGAYSGGQKNTFDHFATLGNDTPKDPFEVLKERQEEGLPEIRTRLHSCQKIQVATLRNILVGFGVDMNAQGDPPTAGQLWSDGLGALGAANYDSRVGESLVWTAAGAAKMFDILVQAAPEIIANLPNVAQCQVDGKGPQVFDEQNHCVPDAVTCLIGRPATPDHLAICNAVVTQASDVEKGKSIAVATLLSAAHSCE